MGILDNAYPANLPTIQAPRLTPDLQALAASGGGGSLPVPPLNLPQVGAQAPALPQASQPQQSFPGLKRPPPPVGTTINGLTYMGGDPRSTDPSVWKPAAGDTFLNSLPIDDNKKTIIKQIANYELPAGSGRGGLPSSPEVQQLVGFAKQYDPNFDASDYATRQGVKLDFAKGKYSQTINALNTAIDHASLLAADGTSLNNSSVPAYNWLKNTYQDATGDPRQGNFSQVARYLGGEVTKATTGGQGGEQDRQAATGDYRLNGSPEQQKQALAQTVNVLKSKLDELDATYKKGMGPQHNITDLLSPSARKSWGILSAQYGASGPGGQTAPAPAVSAPKTVRFQDLP